MKTNLLNPITAIACLCIWACDVDYDPPPIPTTKTTCITAVDAYTNEPLDSVLVEMRLRYVDSDTVEYDADFHGFSDENGNGCVTYDKGSSLRYLLSCSKPGYITYSYGENVNWFYIDKDIEVKLFPAAEMRVHVKNEAPNEPTDLLFLIIPNADQVSQDTLAFEGSDVDTTWVTTISAGYHYLKWLTFDLQSGLKETKEKYFFEKNVSTDIEILY